MQRLIRLITGHITDIIIDLLPGPEFDVETCWNDSYFLLEPISAALAISNNPKLVPDPMSTEFLDLVPHFEQAPPVNLVLAGLITNLKLWLNIPRNAGILELQSDRSEVLCVQIYIDHSFIGSIWMSWLIWILKQWHYVMWIHEYKF